jgi:TonB family protein
MAQPTDGFVRLYGFIKAPKTVTIQRLKRGLASGLFCALLLAGSQTAQDPDPVYEVGKGVLPPRISHQVDPQHPSRGFRVSGTVLIGLIVRSSGEPDEVHVVRSLEKEVDQAAVDAVKQWRFLPATKDGKPVAVKIAVEIRFHDM